MKSVNSNEMRNVNGGVAFVLLAGVAVAAGTSLGVAIRIAYEHAKYGRCITYPSKCWTCKQRAKYGK